MPRIQPLYQTRDFLLDQIVVGLKRSLEAPAMTGLNSKEIEAVAGGFSTLLSGWEALNAATSGSNKGYELTDLPLNVAALHREATHLVNVLLMIAKGKAS